MCGIHGVASLTGPAPQGEVLERMGGVTMHRGPDDSGGYVGEGIALGMRRLAIIDLDGGHQPLCNEQQTLWLVCNGEVYNFRELRRTLQARGCVFRTGSDSEVILHAYEVYGDDFVQHLDGMYGFALWDVRRRRLLLGRDRLGIKPLYYYQDHRRLIFASEAKAILEAGVAARLDPVALDAYLSLGYVPAPYSLFEGIKKLPPAALLSVEQGRVRLGSYWSLPLGLDHRRSERDWSEAVAARLEAAVHEQMVSDVPIGAFLSGGIDSSAVVAYMARYSEQPVRSYAIGFDSQGAGGYYNELPHARRVAELFHTQHREIIVRPDVVGLLPQLLWHLDEPIADTAFVTTYLVSKFARQDSTVILCGVGGDELFGGYRRYLGEHYMDGYRRVPAPLRRGIGSLARHLPSDRHSPLLNLSRLARSFLLSAELTPEDRYRSYVQVFSPELRGELLHKAPEHRYDALGAAFGQSRGQDGLQGLMAVDLLTQLPDDLLMLTDKMTMAVSLECRVPFLDHRLVELAAGIPAGLRIRKRNLKHILKQSLADVLPRDILYRSKRGFGAPMGAWLKQELAPLLKTLLSPQAVRNRGLLDGAVVERTMALHQANREDHTDHLLALLNLELWCRLYLDKHTPADVAAELSELVN